MPGPSHLGDIALGRLNIDLRRADGAVHCAAVLEVPAELVLTRPLMVSGLLTALSVVGVRAAPTPEGIRVEYTAPNALDAVEWAEGLLHGMHEAFHPGHVHSVAGQPDLGVTP